MPNATELYFRIAKGKIDLTKLRDIKHVNGVLQIEKSKVTSKKDKHESDVYKKINKKEKIVELKKENSDWNSIGLGWKSLDAEKNGNEIVFTSQDK